MPDEVAARAQGATERPEAPGYWECRRIIERLRRFQDLVRHRDRYASDIGRARPLAELLPDLPQVPSDGYHQNEAIETAIRRLVIHAAYYLDMAGARTRVRQPAEGLDEKDTWRHVVCEYLELPPWGGRYYGALMGAIEEGVGFYSTVRDQRLRQARNPLRWGAPFTRLLKWYSTAPWQTQIALAIILLAAFAPRWVPPVADLLRATLHGK